MNRRETLLELARTGRLTGDRVPAAFFLHFPDEFHSGRAAVDKHVEYFRATGNDIVKVQYEHTFPKRDDIASARDWASMPVYDEAFYADQLAVVEGVVNKLKAEAVVIVTLYSPFMFAEQTVGADVLSRHLEDDPAAVAQGLERIVESMAIFIRGCIARGVDGFYGSTQGGEKARLPAGVFDDYVKPTDLMVWDLYKDTTEFNVLHVCDYVAPYESFDRYREYPGQIVSAPTDIDGRRVSGSEIARIFDRPFFGGMERLGVLSTGPVDAVHAEARAAIEAGPSAMILGADCTLAADTDWTNIAAATGVAHSTHPA
ncbi:MAG: hypothetical protein EA382_09065 [Spirochaetaceae bacterium]|nr:MAG: hypothetical protein EA382_09065 [Spirochaetaceae bacterium]